MLDIIIIACYIFTVDYKNNDEVNVGVKDYSLRQIKHAKTRIAIMDAFIKRLEKTRFDDIAIREICKSVEISEGTFFNYFPQKIDIVNYYVSLMFIEVIWKMRKDAPSNEYINTINTFFAIMAEEMLIYDNVVYQIISLTIMQRERPKRVAISNLEKQIYFPNYEGVDSIEPALVDDFLKECLTGAVKNGELPKDTDIGDVLVSLTTILVGTLLSVKFSNIKNKSYHYRRQLQLLWKALGARKAMR